MEQEITTAAPPRRLTARRVRELLDCDPKAGTLIWKERPGSKSFNSTFAGKPARECIASDGYARIKIDGRQYPTHRVIFLHTKGYWPPDFLDHHDGNRANRAIGNLRPATITQNNSNRAQVSKKGNPRGCRQIKGRWHVYIQADKKRVYVGAFAEREAAARAYLDAAELLHGKFSVAERPAAQAAAPVEPLAAA